MKRIILSALLILAAIVNIQAQDLDAQYAKDLLKAGTSAPDFTLRTADGKDIKLNTYRGNYVVLDFWASWCPDCRKDIPAMKELWREFMDYNVRIIGVSFDTNKDAWVKTYWEKYQMNWTQVSELKKWKKETVIDRLYKVNWIPTMYLIDPNGKIVLGTVQIEKLRETLEALKPQMKMSQADITAQYIGGDSAINAYLLTNQLYTASTRKMMFEADVLVSFTVEMDGAVTGARAMEIKNLKPTNPKFNKLKTEKQQQIMTDADQHFRAEAVRLVSKMPKWKPAEKNGRPVKDKKTLLIHFNPNFKDKNYNINYLKNYFNLKNISL